MYECKMAENHLMYPVAMSRPVRAGRPKSCVLAHDQGLTHNTARSRLGMVWT